MAPTLQQIQLIRDYEPALYFFGGDAVAAPERFFPSDAKRYLEHCSLRKAKAPFGLKDNWGAPLVEAGKLRAIESEANAGAGEVFLGKKTDLGAYEYLETPSDQESFFEMSGWKATGNPPQDLYANLDRLAQRYADEPALKDSQFWYHAEFFDTDRLRRLFVDMSETGETIIKFTELLTPTGGTAAVLTDPALICYTTCFTQVTTRHWVDVGIPPPARSMVRPASSAALPVSGPASRCCSTAQTRAPTTYPNGSG